MRDITRADIVIIGGGIIGSSIAWHLASQGAGNIVVAERDVSYAEAATPRSNGGIRRLFSLPENIQMASHGLEFYRDFASTMALDDTPADINFRRQGYLFISDNGGSEQMTKNHDLQASMGVDVEALDRAALKAKFPSIDTEDVELAVLSANDAWIDPHAALMGFRASAREHGVQYIEAEVQGLNAQNGIVRRAICTDKSVIEADVFVNACGAWCAPLCKSLGMDLPVSPMSRESYYFRCANPVEPLPFLKSETDLAFRPDSEGYIGGVPDWNEKPGWNFDVSARYFEQVVWPMLAKRVPAMQELRLIRSWRGHYARSEFDLSPVLGPLAGRYDNLYLANGFSGHGIMHAPATGRGLAEHIMCGAYSSIDLGCFAYERIVNNKPYREKGIV